MQASILRELSILELVENKKRLQQAVFELEDLLATLEEERDEALVTREMLRLSYDHIKNTLPGPLRRMWDFMLTATPRPQETQEAPVMRTEPAVTHPRKHQSLSLSFSEEKEEEPPSEMNHSVVVETTSPIAEAKTDTFVLEEAVALPLKVRKPEQPPAYPRPAAKHKTLRASKSQNMPRQTTASKRKSDLN